jgi:hypothetical protein
VVYPDEYHGIKRPSFLKDRIAVFRLVKKYANVINPVKLK